MAWCGQQNCDGSSRYRRNLESSDSRSCFITEDIRAETIRSFEAIEQPSINNAIDSLPARCRVVIANKGQKTQFRGVFRGDIARKNFPAKIESQDLLWILCFLRPVVDCAGA